MLSPYLRDGVDQRRLLAAMADGHARRKHGAELGGPSPAAYRARVKHHLEHAPRAFAVREPGGPQRYFIADAEANRVAWITPHKEHRSTFFEPRLGVREYVRRHLAASPDSQWRRVDLTAIRGTPARSRTVDRRVGRAGPARD